LPWETNSFWSRAHGAGDAIGERGAAPVPILLRRASIAGKDVVRHYQETIKIPLQVNRFPLRPAPIRMKKERK
jgi:hypothetical protein